MHQRFSSYQFVLVFLANLVGKLIKLLLQLSIVQMHFDWNSLKLSSRVAPSATEFWNVYV